MASHYGLTVYDTLYLALAEEHGAAVYSADRKLLEIAATLNLL